MSKSPTISKKTPNTFDSLSVTPEAEPDVAMPVDSDFKRPSPDIVKLNGIQVTPEYLEDLAFFEGPVKVIFSESHLQFAAPYVECGNNGTGFEQFFDGKWMKLGQVAVGEEVIVKRKYLDTLGRARETALRIDIVQRPNENPLQNVKRSSAQKYPFTVIDHMATDAKGLQKSMEWLTNLMSGR